MSGELFNETDNKFYIFYFGQQGLWAQGFGKTEPKWQCMGKNGKIFFRNMRMKRIDAHVMRIRLAIPRWFPSGLRLEKR